MIDIINFLLGLSFIPIPLIAFVYVKGNRVRKLLRNPYQRTYINLIVYDKCQQVQDKFLIVVNILSCLIFCVKFIITITSTGIEKAKYEDSTEPKMIDLVYSALFCTIALYLVWLFAGFCSIQAVYKDRMIKILEYEKNFEDRYKVFIYTSYLFLISMIITIILSLIIE